MPKMWCLENDTSYKLGYAGREKMEELRSEVSCRILRLSLLAFDLLKQKGWTWQLQLYCVWFQNLFLRLDKLGGKGPDKNLDSYPH
jgi:hypothetical protein